MHLLAERFNRILITSLAITLLLALSVRLALLFSPQAELEADEAIVGLMALHILEGERPVFYYMQPYLGSLEAYLVAGSFAVLGGTTLALKLVPLLVSLLFVGLLFETGRRLGGPAVGAAAGLYAAVPPSFLAIWSLKARGGYIETLALGQVLLLVAMRVAGRGAIGAGEGIILGFLAGFGLWVNPLIVVYLLPVAAYLLFCLRWNVFGWWMLPGGIAAIVGALPLIDFNLRNGLATAQAMFGGPGGLAEAPLYVYRFFRYSLPVIAGAAQASSSDQLFWPAFERSLAGRWPVAAVIAAGFLALLAANLKPILALLNAETAGRSGRSLLALLLLTIPGVFVVSRFRDLLTEPRYLLPMYSAIPLLAATLVSGRLRRGALVVAISALLGLNIYSIATLDPALNLPDTAAGSRASNRAELADYLLDRGLDRVYTDYWIAYPLAFETGEKVIPAVMSGGFNRYVPYAHLVSIAPDPAFVFVAGSKEEAAFDVRLAQAGARAQRDTVSIYSVYSQVDPVEAVKP